MQIAKAGWLQRQSSILKRWKLQWVVLYTDGRLSCFDNIDDARADEAYVLPGQCAAVLCGEQCVPCTMPPDRRRDSLIQVNLRSGSGVLLCAESADDASAWKFSIEEAAAMSTAGPCTTHVSASPNTFQGAPPHYPQPPPPSYYSQPAPPPHYPQQTRPQMPPGSSPYPRQQVTYAYPGQYLYSTAQNQAVYQPQPGAPNVVVVQDSHHCCRRNDDLAAGMLLGAALWWW